MKMLVCTDGSEESRKAVQEAVRIADNLKEVEVTLLFVHEIVTVPLRGEGWESVPEEVLLRYETLKEKDAEDMLKKKANFFKEKGIKCQTLLKKGNPAEGIIEEAEKGYDLVVMGSRGLGGVKRILLGSVSNAVVQQAKTNVLIIK